VATARRRRRRFSAIDRAAWFSLAAVRQKILAPRRAFIARRVAAAVSDVLDRKTCNASASRI